MHDLTQLSIADLAALSRFVLKAGQDAQSMESCAARLVEHFYQNLSDGRGGKACALVRFFKTHALADLDSTLQSVARTALTEGVEAQPGMRCLTLLATAGDEAAWNSRHASAGHKVIPLPSAKIVQQFPMIAQLISQLGFNVAEVIAPDPTLIVNLEERATSVFFVADALGSPFIPAQESFVVPHRIRTVMGFGGVLPSGNLFVIVLFTKSVVPKDRAELLNVLAVGVKAAILEFDYGKVFDAAG